MKIRFITILFICFFLFSCASTPRFSQKEVNDSGRTTVERGGRRDVLLSLDGVASYYADEFHGRQTSNGEIFDMNGISAAHRTFPFGTLVRVTNLENSRQIVVRINDRGPFVDGRMIDLSLGAAKELEMIPNGTAKVKLEVIEWGRGK